jgi:hypothetical protein
LAFGPFSAVIEATNMTGATVSNEMEAESKLDKITKQVDGIMLANSATRILVAKMHSLRLPRKMGYALLFHYNKPTC